jgi:O-antigen biosynthesis protein WbqP
MTIRNPAYIDFFRGLDPSLVDHQRLHSTHNFPHLNGKRLFDIALALPLCLLALPIIIVLGITVRLTSRGPAIYWSRRVGKDNRIFSMPKLRTMRDYAPQLATHLLSDPEQFLTPLGILLCRTSLDELPQLFSILAGDLSLAGPRPALSNQADLIDLRTGLGIETLLPGLTGWAQVNGRDGLTLEEKVQFDAEYMRQQSFLFDLRILAITAKKVVLREGIRH